MPASAFTYNPRPMDDALKARLIGAGILVVIAVALLPELLSGPKTPATDGSGGKGTRMVTIDLGGAVEASRAPRPDVAPKPVAAPQTLPTLGAPAATTAALGDPADAATGMSLEPVAVPPATGPGNGSRAEPEESPPVPSAVATPAPATAKPAVAPAPAPKASAGSGKYSVQVGAFSVPDGARKLAGELKGAGFPAYVIAPAPGKKLHRVRVGPVADRAAADQLAVRLKARGLPVAVASDG